MCCIVFIVLDLDPADLRPEAVEAVVVAEQLLAVLELVGQAGGGRLVVLGLLAVPDGRHGVAVLALALLLGPLAGEGPEGCLQLAGRGHGLVVVAADRDELGLFELFLFLNKEKYLKKNKSIIF